MCSTGGAYSPLIQLISLTILSLLLEMPVAMYFTWTKKANWKKLALVMLVPLVAAVGTYAVIFGAMIAAQLLRLEIPATASFIFLLTLAIALPSIVINKLTDYILGKETETQTKSTISTVFTIITIAVFFIVGILMSFLVEIC